MIRAAAASVVLVIGLAACGSKEQHQAIRDNNQAIALRALQACAQGTDVPTMGAALVRAGFTPEKPIGQVPNIGNIRQVMAESQRFSTGTRSTFPLILLRNEPGSVVSCSVSTGPTGIIPAASITDPFLFQLGINPDSAAQTPVGTRWQARLEGRSVSVLSRDVPDAGPTISYRITN